MDISKLTTLNVPVALKYDEELDAWVASAKTLSLTETGCTQDLALSRLRDRVRDELTDGFGAASDLRISAEILSVKAEISVERYHRVDRTLAEFAAPAEEAERTDDEEVKTDA